jgi:YgiT-type zinc finger domain-containing protein
MARMEPITCPRCDKLTHAAMVRSNVWQGDCLIVVEDIPAQLCEVCGEQYYDPFTGEALRKLLQDEMKTEKPKRVMEVPVYSLEGRIRLPEEMPEEGEEPKWEVEGEY